MDSKSGSGMGSLQELGNSVNFEKIVRVVWCVSI